MGDTMVAGLFTARTGVGDFELTEVPVPEPGVGEVLVRVEACGICLSDVHLLDGGIPPVRKKVIPGHEAAGVIAALGSGVEGWSEGDRVSLMGGRYCGHCPRCVSGRPLECQEFQIMGFHFNGAWAEYIVVPAYGLARVPEGVPVEHAAILADAVSTPFAALSDTGRLEPGESVALWGIGGLGTHAVQLARMIGASTVIAVDPLASARDRALKVGADAAIDPSTEDVRRRVLELTDGMGVDLALDLVGANAVLKQAVSCLARRGRAVIVGLSLDPIQLGPSVLFGTRANSLLGHLGYGKSHLDDLMTLLARGRLDLTASISDVIPLERVAEGVDRLARKEGDPVRIVVEP